MGAPKMKKENERHFDMEGEGGAYRIAKAGLSEEMLKRIRGYAHGDIVKDDGGGYTDPMAIPPRQDSGGFIFTADGKRIPVPVAPESGTATYVVPGQEPQAVDTPADEAHYVAAEPMRSGAGEAPVSRPGFLSGIGDAIGKGLPIVGAVKAGVEGDKAVDQQRMKESDDRKRLGLVPPGEAPPEPAAGAPPAPAAAPAAPRVGFRPFKADMSATEAAAAEQKAAIGASADVAAETARQQARVLDAQHQEMERIEGQRRARTDKAMQETQAAMSNHQAAVDEMKNINTTVDPGRYWATRSTGQRILGIAGLVFGALGAGKDGINRAAGMLQQAIDRDVEAQKVELSARLQKGRAAVEGAQSMYAQAREHFQDEGAAMAAAKASAYELAKNQFEQLTASAAAPAAKAQAQMAIAGIDAKVADLKNEASEKEAKSRIEAGLAGAQATHLYAQSAGAGGKADAATQRGLSEIEERERNIQQNGADLLSMIDQYGTGEKMAPGVEAKMHQKINALIVDSAKMQDREGVVREPDELREKKSLGFEPGFFQRSSAAKAAIKGYLSQAQQRRRNAYAARGLQAP